MANFEKIAGSPEILLANLKVYPNPFTDTIRITSPTPTLPQMGMGQYVRQIINAAGIVVHTQTITGNDETNRLGHLPEGVYFLEKKGYSGMVSLFWHFD